MTIAALFLLALAADVPAPEQALPAERFIDAIGVCTHWSYPDTPYGFAYERVKQRLVASGIRHVRDGASPRIEDLARVGVHSTVVVDADRPIAEQLRRIKEANLAVPGAVVAVEGPNEPDLFWEQFKKSYKGQGHEQGQVGIIRGTIAFQRDLYAAVKADPATARLTVIGPSLGRTYDPGAGKPNPLAKGILADAVDWGNFHPYPGGNPFSVPFPYGGLEKFYWQGNFPSINLDEFPVALDVYAPPFAPRPMGATETGYSTNTGDGVSEPTHAKYIPRLYAEYVRKGIRRAYVYEFVDEFDRPGDREARFGLLRRDLSAKPAYDAIKSLITLLAEPPAATTPPAAGKLAYRIDVEPAGGFDRVQYVHRLLLRKRDGEFYLLPWHEVSAEDTSVRTHRTIEVPPLPARLHLPASIRQVTRYIPNDGTNGQDLVLDGGTVHLTVPDRLVVLRLRSRPGR